MVHIEGKVLEELSKPWKEALVMKLLGKTLGFNLMKNKLASTWKVMRDIEIMDIENGYFMVLFVDNEDRIKVINGGSWIIFDLGCSLIITYQLDYGLRTLLLIEQRLIKPSSGLEFLT